MKFTVFELFTDTFTEFENFFVTLPYTISSLSVGFSVNSLFFAVISRSNLMLTISPFELVLY